MNVSMVGLDLAKNVFQAHGAELIRRRCFPKAGLWGEEARCKRMARCALARYQRPLSEPPYH